MYNRPGKGGGAIPAPEPGRAPRENSGWASSSRWPTGKTACSAVLAQAEADTREAKARRRAEVREAAASIKVAEARNELRVRQAELDREGETAEKIARVKAQEAEVEAEKVLEMKRVEREEQRLRADVIEPAKAQVEVLRRLYAEVQTGGDAAFAVFMAEKLPELLEIAVGAVEGVDIDRLVVMDGGQGEGVYKRPEPARARRLRHDGGARVGARPRHPESPAAGRGLGRLGRRRGVGSQASADLDEAGCQVITVLVQSAPSPCRARPEARCPQC